MTTVFVYEDVTATGAGGDRGSPPAPSLLAEGRAMRDAVTADFAALRALGVSPTCLSPTSGFHALAARADWTLVIAPESGGRLEYLSREVLRAGGRLLGPSPDAISLTADKLALARHWEHHGVRTPPTTEWRPDSDRVGPAQDRNPAPTVPVVVKPRDGAGSQDTIRWDRLETYPTETGGRPRIVQPFIPGFAASVAFLIGPSRVVPLVPSAQHLSADGRFQYQGGRLPIAPELAERALRIATAAVTCVPGLLGYVGVDVILGDDGHDWAIEINPRLTTSYVGLRALARFNLTEAILAVVRGEPPPEMTWADGPIEFTPDGRLSPGVRPLPPA